MSGQKTASAPIEDTDSRWPAMLHDWTRYQWQRVHRGADLEDWPPPWALPALSIAGLAVLVAVVAGVIVPLVRAIAGFVAAAVDGGADWVLNWNIARVVLDPVRTWIDTHSAGLPVGADTLWWTWATTGIVLFVLGMCTVTAARIGWVLFGAATTAMVYTATTGPARATAAAITVLWWLLLSLAALRRRRSTSHVYAWLPQLPTLARLLQRDTD